MCGIWSILNKDPNSQWPSYAEAVEAGKPRGPEQTETITSNGVHHVFHRLAINGLDDNSMMPMTIDDCTLICNGEIYNYHELCDLLNVTPQTKNDCEIIIHLYRKVGIKRCAEMLDGEFAFVLEDKRVTNESEPDKIFFVRDPYGVRPMFLFTDEQTNIISVASEMKVLHKLSESGNISQIAPGTITTVHKEWRINATWHITTTERYHNIVTTSSTFMPLDPSKCDITSYLEMIVDTLSDAVKKRVSNTDRPVACLLSGGLDSSIVAALASKLYNGKLKTYGIGFSGSLDLLMASQVASYIGSDHESIVLTEDEFLSAIPEVVKSIESYDTTTVRASVGNYLVAKKIAELGKEKVILNGDGSDEVTGGYIYFLETPNDVAFDAECRRLVENIHYFDVLRSDRSVSSHGLEPRTPFLDKSFVQIYMSIPACLRNPKSEFNKHFILWDVLASKYGEDSHLNNMIKSRSTKLLLRAAFQFYANDLLPAEILWRTKEAFSDGVSGQERSWYQVIQDHVKSINFDVDAEVNAADTHMIPTTKEQAWYRKLFCDAYPERDNVIPYFWMPKWVDATDASARTLQCYKTALVTADDTDKTMEIDTSDAEQTPLANHASTIKETETAEL